MKDQLELLDRISSGESIYDSDGSELSINSEEMSSTSDYYLDGGVLSLSNIRRLADPKLYKPKTELDKELLKAFENCEKNAQSEHSQIRDPIYMFGKSFFRLDTESILKNIKDSKDMIKIVSKTPKDLKGILKKTKQHKAHVTIFTSLTEI